MKSLNSRKRLPTSSHIRDLPALTVIAVTAWVIHEVLLVIVLG